MEKKLKVLFLSRGNASRSQMAARLLGALGDEEFIPYSAGTEAADVHPLVKEVMQEIGIDISTQMPVQIAALFRDTFHCVVSLCDERRERYPLFPFTRKILRWSVPDPEAVSGGPEAKEQAFRQVREELTNRVQELAETLTKRKRAMPVAHAAAA